MNKIQQAFVVFGSVALGSTFALPSLALPSQAYATGSSSVVLLNGASMSIGAEIAAPRGAGFLGAGGADGNVTVTPGYYDSVAGAPVTTAAEALAAVDANAISFASLSVDPGAATLAPPAAPTSVEAAVATKITALTAAGVINANALPDVTSYVRAWQSGLK